MIKKYLSIMIMIVGLSVLTACSFLDNDKANDGADQEQLEENEYDVIVIGGEPEGVAAAVSAARNGAKTLLVESRDELGGLFTYGMLNFLDIPQGEDGVTVSQGIFQEWHQMVGGRSAFGIDEAKTAFRQLVEAEETLTLLTETEVEDVILTDKQITGVTLSNNETVTGKTFIDATQDADFAVKTGAPYFTGGEDIGLHDKKMSVTLMIHLKNVDWGGIRETVESEKFGPAGMNDTAAWGFVDLHHVYEAVEENTRLRGLNLAKVGDDYYINALQIFGVDGLDEVSKAEAIERGKRETENILAYLQQNFPGFEQAEIASYPMELYVRETRHIMAEYQLPMSDVWTNKDHWDNIAYGAYPVDIQAQTPQDYGAVVSNPKQYAIPFRSLIPQEIDGLLVVGRSAGYSSIAAGSARIVPTGMATGEAAGAAAVLSIEENLFFRDFSKNKPVIETLRDRLTQQGAFVEHLTTDYPYENEWYDSAIQNLMDYGLLKGGYDNDLKVDEPAPVQPFVEMLAEVIFRVNFAENEQAYERAAQIDAELAEQAAQPLTSAEAAEILTEVFYEGESRTDNWQILIENELISSDLVERIQDQQPLTNKEMFAINAAVMEYLK